MTKQEIMAAIESLSQNERHEIIDHIFKFEEEQKPRFSLGMGQFAAWRSPSYPEKWLVGISLQKETNATSAIMGEYLSQYGCIRQTRMDNTQDVTPLDIYIDFNRLIELTKLAEEQPKVFAERVRQKCESIWRADNEQV